MDIFSDMHEEVMALESNHPSRRQLRNAIGNEAVVKAFISTLASAGVKFAERGESEHYFKRKDNAKAIGTACMMAQVSNSTTLNTTVVNNNRGNYEIVEIGPAVVACSPYLKEAKYIWICVLNKNQKPKAFQFTMGRISKMFDKDTNQINREKVGKYAKAVMKRAQNTTSEAPSAAPAEDET